MSYILGIETSCDETAAAVVRSGEQVVSNVVASQIATHWPYGGVVPELASREHLRAIVPVVRRALEEAGQTYESVDAVAVTQGPGLAGALLVGVSYAKALAFALDKPLIAVNHLEGHIHAVLLEEKQKGNREIGFPVLALVVSGGHTHLYLAEQQERGLDLRERRPDPRRRCRRGLRQSGEAAGARLSRRAGDRQAGAPRQSRRSEVPARAHQGTPAPGPQPSPGRRRYSRLHLRLFLQRNQDRGAALHRDPQHAASDRATPSRRWPK